MIIDDYEKVKGIDLTINPTLHQRNWTYYYQQYITAFSCLLDVSRLCKNQTNFRYMAFLFLMRHSLELLLKNRKHSKKCTFYTLRFGCSFAAVNTIKPQLL